MGESLTLQYDGSLDGFFSTVFAVYAKHYDAVNVSDKPPYDLFARTVEISTDEAHAKRVWRKLEQRLGRKGLSSLLKAFLHTDADKDNTLLAVIRHVLSHDGKDPLGDFSHPAVLEMAQYIKQIHREIHRIHAFVRFELASDGTYCAGITPDFDLLPLITPFFRKRYRNQKWLIADLSRGYGMYYDGKTVATLPVNLSDWHNRAENYAEGEQFYQQLWQNYFQATCITERKNMKLHKQYVPVRYWQYLTEKQGGYS